MSRVLVTGAGGFVGSRLAGHLVGQGHWVVGTWRQERGRLDRLEAEGVVLKQLDLADAGAVDRFLAEEPFDAIVHAAAWLGQTATADSLRAAVDGNVVGQSNLVTAALKAGCRRFVYCSTISVYGGQDVAAGGYDESQVAPVSVYGWSKRVGEQVLDFASHIDNQLVAVSLRLAGVHGYGRTTGALYAMASAAMRGGRIEVTDPDSCFRWLFIDDMLAATETLLSADLSAGHHVCNLASADTFSLRDLAGRIQKLVPSAGSITCSGNRQRYEVMNIARAQALFGFSPFALDEFLPRYLDELAAGL